MNISTQLPCPESHTKDTQGKKLIQYQDTRKNLASFFSFLFLLLLYSRNNVYERANLSGDDLVFARRHLVVLLLICTGQ